MRGNEGIEGGSVAGQPRPDQQRRNRRWSVDGWGVISVCARGCIAALADTRFLFLPVQRERRVHQPEG